MNRGEFKSPEALKAMFNTLDNFKYKDKWWVIDIGANNLRLMAFIEFRHNRMYVKHIVTHAQYDEICEKYRKYELNNKLAVTEVTELVNELNVRAPVLREISGEQDHNQALALMEELIEDYDTNLVAIEALNNSIARYEADAESFFEFNQRMDAEDPAVETLKVLMDQHGLNTTDFVNEIGKKSMVSQVLNGGKRLTRDHIERLAMRFEISPALFFK